MLKFLLSLILCFSFGLIAQANTLPNLTFSELYSGGGVLGLEFSPKTKSLDGQTITIRGFMAPPLKAEANFFVLTKQPVALCPFCSSDADWPDNIVVVYLSENQEFVQNNATIEVVGRLEIGSYFDEETGFVSQMRLVDATFRKI